MDEQASARTGQGVPGGTPEAGDTLTSRACLDEEPRMNRPRAWMPAPGSVR